jgi:hypothetical protein
MLVMMRATFSELDFRAPTHDLLILAISIASRPHSDALSVTPHTPVGVWHDRSDITELFFNGVQSQDRSEFTAF